MKQGYNCSDHEFASNYFADKLADIAAENVQCGDLSQIRPTLFGIKLVSQIQKRIAAIFDSGVIPRLKKSNGVDDVDPLERKCNPPIEDLLVDSQHVLVGSDASYRCVACLHSKSKKSRKLKEWLKGPCCPMPICDVQDPVAPVHDAGRGTAHGAHSMSALYEYRYRAVGSRDSRGSSIPVLLRQPLSQHVPASARACQL